MFMKKKVLLVLSLTLSSLVFPAMIKATEVESPSHLNEVVGKISLQMTNQLILGCLTLIYKMFLSLFLG